MEEKNSPKKRIPKFKFILSSPKKEDELDVILNKRENRLKHNDKLNNKEDLTRMLELEQKKKYDIKILQEKAKSDTLEKILNEKNKDTNERDKLIKRKIGIREYYKNLNITFDYKYKENKIKKVILYNNSYIFN